MAYRLHSLRSYISSAKSDGSLLESVTDDSIDSLVHGTVNGERSSEEPSSEDKDDASNNERVLEEVFDHPQIARHVTISLTSRSCISLFLDDDTPQILEVNRSVTPRVTDLGTADEPSFHLPAVKQ